jgi:hypothetical protein
VEYRDLTPPFEDFGYFGNRAGRTALHKAALWSAALTTPLRPSSVYPW